MSRTVEPQDIRHIAGDTLEQGFRLNELDPDTHQSTPLDLTGWVPSALLWNARTQALQAGLSVSLANQTTDPGVLTLEANAEVTAAWTAGPSLEYSVMLTEVSTGFIKTVIIGRFLVERR